MINSAPNNKNYNQGNFIPKNKDKVIILNDKGGVYYRSGLELKVMVYLDNKKEILKWNSEIIKIPYIKKTWDNRLQQMVETEHIYYPDIYYELLRKDGTVSRVVGEIKPEHETQPPVLPKKKTQSSTRRFEYALKEYSKNLDKMEILHKLV